MGLITFTLVHDKGPLFWINRGPQYSFSFVWWPSTPVPITRGYRFDGLGPALGYKILLRFKTEFWHWTSNSYTMDFILEDAYAIDPANNPIFGFQPVHMVCTRDEGDVFPIIRLYGNPFVGQVENIAPLPPYNPDYWLKPSGRLVSLPAIRPYPR